jgi:hypothetical protein
MESNTNRDRPTEASSEMEKKLADILAARNAQDGALWGISGAAISGAAISGAAISGAQISGAAISGAQISGAAISGAQISGADTSVSTCTSAAPKHPSSAYSSSGKGRYGAS